MEDTLKDLQKQLGKKQSFESAAASLAVFVRDNYAAAPSAIRDLMYTTVCRVATLLQTRYSAPGFWSAGLKVFQEAEKLFLKPSESTYIKKCISRIQEHLGEIRDEEEPSPSQNQNRDSRFLFEGQLTVGQEPSPPAWLSAQNLLTALAMSSQTSNMVTESHENHGEEANTSESNVEDQAANAIAQMLNNLQGMTNFGTDLEQAIENALQEVGSGPQRPPPASKRVMANMPVVEITEGVLAGLGKETECAVCREHLDVGDKMQELPCKHLFHPDCLKPWMEEHNSCPVCRFELETDDAEYELRKEREKEAEEERKGAANAVRGGEYMYV